MPEEPGLPEAQRPGNVRLQPSEVPVFGCIVYMSAASDGQVRARVANLPALEFTAASERAALAKTVAAFKRRLSELLQSGAEIPWIEPPAPIEPGEQKRFVPVHL